MIDRFKLKNEMSSRYSSDSRNSGYGSGMVTGRSHRTNALPESRRQERTRPEDIISLDGDDFGKY